METIFRSVSNTFKLGEHFNENVVDRREVDSVWSYDPDSVCLKTVHVDKQGTNSELSLITETEPPVNMIVLIDAFQYKERRSFLMTKSCRIKSSQVGRHAFLST